MTRAKADAAKLVVTPLAPERFPEMPPVAGVRLATLAALKIVLTDQAAVCGRLHVLGIEVLQVAAVGVADRRPAQAVAKARRLAG